MTSEPSGGVAPVVVVTATLPWGHLEDFFEPELTELAELVTLVIVPVWPRRPAPAPSHPLVGRAEVCRPLSLGVIAAAALETLRRPAVVLRILRLVGRGPLRPALRNLSVVPKGLWLARRVRALGARHLHSYWASIPATVAMVASEASGVPWSMTAHRGDLDPQNLIAEKVACVAWIRSISEATSALLTAVIAGEGELPPVHVIHLGVTIPQLPQTTPRPPTRLRVLCAAQLIPLKRHLDLLATVRLLVDQGRDVELLVAGTGPQEGTIRRRVEELSLGASVRLLGHVDHQDLLEMYRVGKVDLVVLASEVEGIPVSLMEAMAAGVPVVATNVGGVRELLGSGAGSMVPAGDVGALAAAIARLDQDAQARELLGAAGRRRVEDGFDARVTASHMAELLSDV